MPTLTEPDLDASVDLLAFMWIALGNHPSSVRPHERLLARAAIEQNFDQLPPSLQKQLAEGRLSLAEARREWEESDDRQRASLRAAYRQALERLGLIRDTAPPL